MSKTQKELAFLRDLYIETDYTERFTDIFDENFKFSDEEKILYINAGAGNHALALRKKLGDERELYAVSENQELLNIANHKTAALKTQINFSTEYPNGKFDAVLADASFIKSNQAKDFLKRAIDSSTQQVAFFLPTAGSFGEVFSLLWETFLNMDLAEKGAAIENLINDIPQISVIEDAARKAGLKEVETITKNEFFEFKDGDEFINAPLIADFLMPVWLDFFDDGEREEVLKKLAQTINEDCTGMTFRLSFKATLLVGGK